MKRGATLKSIQHINGFHMVCIKYFTAPALDSTALSADSTMLDDFVDVLQYSPLDESRICELLTPCKSENEVTAALRDNVILDESKIFVISSLALALENQISSFENQAKIAFAYETVMRAFISICQILPKILTESSSELELADISHNTLCFLLESPVNVFKDFVVCLDFLLSLITTDNLSLFLRFKSLYNGFFKSLAPFITKIESQQTIQFLLSIINNILKTRSLLDEFIDFLPDISIFLQKAIIMKQCIESKDIISAASKLIQECAKSTQQNEVKATVLFCDCLKFLSVCSYFSDISAEALPTLEYIDNLASLYDIPSSFTPPTENNEEENLKSIDESLYFQTHQFIEPPSTRNCKQSQIDSIIRSIRSFFATSTKSIPAFMNAICHRKPTDGLLLFLVSVSNGKFDQTSGPYLEFVRFLLNSNFDHPVSRNIILGSIYTICSISTEMLQSVIDLVSQMLQVNNISRVDSLLPLFRSLLIINDQIGFVRAFFNSSICTLFLSNSEQMPTSIVDRFIAFMAVMVKKNPIEAFSSKIYFAFFVTTFQIERYNSLMVDAFNSAVVSCVNTHTDFSVSTFGTVLSILDWMIANSSLEDLDNSCPLLDSIAENIQLMNWEILKVFEESHFFDGVMTSLKQKQTERVLCSFLQMAKALSFKFPEAIRMFTANKTLLFTTLIHSKLTSQMYTTIRSIMFNSNTEGVIMNPIALKLLYSVVPNTAFEESFFAMLIRVCSSSLSNIFECINSGILDYLFSRICKSELTKACIALFKLVGASFFTPIFFKKTVEALLQMKAHQKDVLQAMLELLDNENIIPVNSFFSFVEDSRGIKGPHVQPTYFNDGWAFATSFILKSAPSHCNTLFTLDDELSRFRLVISDSQLLFSYESNQSVTQKSLSYICRNDVWYTFILLYSKRSLSVYIQDLKIDQFDFPKLDFSNKVLISIGIDSANLFYGNIGPIYFFESEDYDFVNREFKKSVNTCLRLSQSFCYYHPDVVYEGTIECPMIGEEPALVSSPSISFCSTALRTLGEKSMQKQFHRLWDICPSSNSLHLLLMLLSRILFVSDLNQRHFMDLGGFSFLVGAFYDYNKNLFTPELSVDFFELYNFLNEDLQLQMAEFVWTNFQLFRGCSFEFLKKFYELLLRIIESSVFKQVNQENLATSCLTTPVSEGQYKQIVPLEFQAIRTIALQNPTGSTIASILYLCCCHEDESIRREAKLILVDLVKRNDQNLLNAFSVYGGISVLPEMFCECPPSISLLSTILKENPSYHSELYQSALSLLQNNQKPGDIQSVLCMAFGVSHLSNLRQFCEKREEIVYPHFLPLLLLRMCYETDDVCSLANRKLVEAFKLNGALFKQVLQYPIWIFLMIVLLNRAEAFKSLFYAMLENTSMEIEVLVAFELASSLLGIDMHTLFEDLVHENAKFSLLTCLFKPAQHFESSKVLTKTDIDKLFEALFNQPSLFPKTIEFEQVQLDEDSKSKCLRILDGFEGVITGNISKDQIREAIASNDSLDLLNNYQETINSAIESIISQNYNRPYIESGFEEFLKWSNKTANLSKKNCTALFNTHIHELQRTSISSDGKKWKVANRLSPYGLCIFRKVNNAFDDHSLAAEMRDSGKPLEALEFVPTTPIVEKKAMRTTSHIRAIFKTVYTTIRARSVGALTIGDDHVFFDGKQEMDSFGVHFAEENAVSKSFEIPIKNIEFIFKRSCLHVDKSCEIFTKSFKSYFFTFSDPDKRNQFLEMLSPNKGPEKGIEMFRLLRKANGSISQLLKPNEIVQKSKITKIWRSRKMSTYTYLLLLNFLAGRSFNDLSQYPVFPFVLSDYTSPSIDLSDPSVYRDLSKPIGALNPHRLEGLIETYQDPFVEEKCLYRTHFSTAANVIGFLIREEPFTSLHIALQSGRFDYPDRLFISMQNVWECITGPTPDYREAIPQFYCSSSFLVNSNHFDLGKDATGYVIDDVILPPYAKSAHHFVAINRMALEGEIVSSTINDWIDLMFGCYINDIGKFNVYHPYTYKCAITEENRILIEAYCTNFGCSPDQIFNEKHPQRKSADGYSELTKQIEISSCILLRSTSYITQDGLIRSIQKPSSKPKALDLIIHDRADYLAFEYVGNQIITILHGAHFGSIYNVHADYKCELIGIITHGGAAILSYTQVGEYFITGGSDCLICVWEIPAFRLVEIIDIHNFPVTALAANEVAGVLVSMSESGEIACFNILSLQMISYFKSFVKEGFYSLGVSNGALIATIVTSFKHTETEMVVFDLFGNQLFQSALSSQVVRMTEVSDLVGNDYFMITEKTGEYVIFDCNSISIPFVSKTRIDPSLVVAIPSHLAVYCVHDGVLSEINLKESWEISSHDSPCK